MAFTRHMAGVLSLMGRRALVMSEDIAPDMVIGDPRNPYLRRWHLREEGPSGGLYLHQILRDDDDRALHDHPWDSSVFIIEGSYKELTAANPDGQLFEAGSYRHMSAETAHRLIVVDGPVWTLVFTGPRRREWGFHCKNADGSPRWVPWQEFVATHNKGEIGKGCG